MKRFLKEFNQGLHNIIFPNVCISCGQNLSEQNRYICSFCLHDRFQDPNPERKPSCSNIILPEGILFQDALWQFDKGGYVQKILHAIKYHGLANLGTELGQLLGKRLLKHPLFLKSGDVDDFILIPVPLHNRKLKQRGYNQARYIAKGISNVSEIPLIDEHKILRIKNTKTQTGFNIQQRLKNVKKAFKVLENESVSGKKVIIIDDVFTTGATSFELVTACKLSKAEKAIILTIAQA